MNYVSLNIKILRSRSQNINLALIAAGTLAILIALFYPVFPDQITGSALIIYGILTILYIYVLLSSRIHGLCLLLFAVLVIPSGSGFTPLTFLTPYIISYYELWLFILLFVWLLDRVNSISTATLRVPFFIRRYWLFLACLLFMYGNGILHENTIGNMLLDLRELSYFTILALIIPDYINSKFDIVRLLTIFAIGAIIGLFIYYIYFFIMIRNPGSILNEIMEKNETAGFRVEYRLGYSINLAIIFSFVVMLAILLQRIKVNFIFFVIFILSFGVILLGQQRTSYILIILSIIMLVYKYIKMNMLSLRRVIRFVVVIFSVIMIGIILFSVVSANFAEALTERLATLTDLDYLLANSLQRFSPFFLETKNFTTKNFLIGKGLGTLIYIPWFDKLDFDPMGRFLDNLYLTYIIKGGVVGILFTISFFIILIRMLNKIIKVDDVLLPLWIGLWCFVFLEMMSGMTASIFFNPFIMIIFGFLAGMILKISATNLLNTKQMSIEEA